MGEEVKLSPKEYDLLCALARIPARSSPIATCCWPDGATPQAIRNICEATSRCCVRSWRRNPAEPRLLTTEPGVGYRLNA